MGKFYGGGTVFPGAVPAGSMLPAAPEGFPPYQLPQHILAAAVPQKQITPPMFDPQTTASLAIGSSAGSIFTSSVLPIGTRPPPVPAALERAVATDYHATVARAVAVSAQRDADAAAHQAQKAADKAAVQLTPDAQDDAKVKARASKVADKRARQAELDRQRAEAQQAATQTEYSTEGGGWSWQDNPPPPTSEAIPYVSPGSEPMSLGLKIGLGAGALVAIGALVQAFRR